MRQYKQHSVVGCAIGFGCLGMFVTQLAVFAGLFLSFRVLRSAAEVAEFQKNYSDFRYQDANEDERKSARE